MRRANHKMALESHAVFACSLAGIDEVLEKDVKSNVIRPEAGCLIPVTVCNKLFLLTRCISGGIDGME